VTILNILLESIIVRFRIDMRSISSTIFIDVSDALHGSIKNLV